jgi:hypothetical protein
MDENNFLQVFQSEDLFSTSSASTFLKDNQKNGECDFIKEPLVFSS